MALRIAETREKRRRLEVDVDAAAQQGWDKDLLVGNEDLNKKKQVVQDEDTSNH
jgi:hypothetical protein